jgi:hypothetical protein
LQSLPLEEFLPEQSHRVSCCAIQSR